jgi:hypothetical protein
MCDIDPAAASDLAIGGGGAEKTYLVGFWKNMAAFARQLPHRHQWLREMVAHRIADPIILEVIGMA